jgi:branched-chain amino acid transport system ATP-binding protein
MTVLENVLSGKYASIKTGLIDALFRTVNFKKEEEDAVKESIALLELFGLRSSMYELASNLPYGKQRRLEIARALASSPSVLLLDEPAAGMNPVETMELMDLLRSIKTGGVTIFLIEHDMKVVMNISDYIHVLNYGEKIAEGTPSEVSKNREVIKAYLGEVKI